MCSELQTAIATPSIVPGLLATCAKYSDCNNNTQYSTHFQVNCCCRFEHNQWAQQTGSPALQKPALDYRLYAVTDPGCNVKCGRSNAEAVQLAVQGGATLIQLREKSADGGAFVKEAQALMDLLRPTGVSPASIYIDIMLSLYYIVNTNILYISSHP